jgi:hypothetical protein
MAAADLGKLKIGDFQPHLDTVFEMHSPRGVVPLKLVEVESIGESGREGGAFSLLFAAAADPGLPQSIYPLGHPDLGTLDIFLVPIGPVPEGNAYQAVFT